MTDKNDTDRMGHSTDAMAQRRSELLALIAQTAPELMADAQQIDLNKLKELLGQAHEAGPEHYELSWAGKAAARREIQKTSSHTLRPSADNPAQAKHMLIEGENLEVLRLLQKSYYGKVKMIYIDPPYNTGSDSFVYPDDYSESLDEYLQRTGEKSPQGHLNKQSLWKKNSKESGQYHSAWLSMMYPRLYLARNLLRDDGVIFISIDDNEAANLKLVCDEIFGNINFISSFIVVRSEGGGLAKQAVIGHDYLLVYAKNIEKFPPLRKPKDIRGEMIIKNGEEYWIEEDWLRKEFGKYGTCPYDEIEKYHGKEKKKEIDAGIANGMYQLILKKGVRIVGRLRKIEGDGSKFYTILKHLNKHGVSELADFGLQNFFSYPKPRDLIKAITAGATFNLLHKDSLILDFFAGSGTTAHAVMELNLEDGGKRQCISVQMPEILDEDSEAYKAGYRSIADITRARIDKVIAKLKTEHPDQTQDLGCAHYTLSPSNFKVWRSDMADGNALREQLALFQSAEKSEPSAKALERQSALLTELLLKYGLGTWGFDVISQPQTVAGVTIHRVVLPNERVLFLCFETYQAALKEHFVRERPQQVIMLNSCFVGARADEALSNLQLELTGLDIGLTLI